MFYYEATVTLPHKMPPDECSHNDSKSNDFSKKVEAITNRFNESWRENTECFLAQVGEEQLSIGVVSVSPLEQKQLIPQFLDALGIPFREILVKEIMLTDAMVLLNLANLNHYLIGHNPRSPINQMRELDKRITGFGESIIPDPLEMSQIYASADELFGKSTLIPHLDKIFHSSELKRSTGLPFIYLIEADDRKVAKSISGLLRQAMLVIEKTSSTRCLLVYAGSRDTKHIQRIHYNLNPLYQDYYNCAAFIRFDPEKTDQVSTEERDMLVTITDTIKQNQGKVLTFLQIPRESYNIKSVVCDLLHPIPIEGIQPSLEDEIHARAYLDRIREEARVQRQSE